MFLHSKTDNYSSPRRRLELRLGGPALASTHREAVDLLDLQGKKLFKSKAWNLPSQTMPVKTAFLYLNSFLTLTGMVWGQESNMKHHLGSISSSRCLFPNHIRPGILQTTTWRLVITNVAIFLICQSVESAQIESIYTIDILDMFLCSCFALKICNIFHRIHQSKNGKIISDSESCVQCLEHFSIWIAPMF